MLREINAMQISICMVQDAVDQMKAFDEASMVQLKQAIVATKNVIHALEAQ
jgi:hypothetical protein